ncbi:hypothetical protein PHYBLDRAFT_73274 [Phycomyces blakesleeanus NRRL 1555(-)]|uniref:HTH La-type RNA-binding domain-containing protein n=1 Tax=Phycomyces blakesleeanus (strain ATCC 8743b / DSM 1359 / FGSC 10004 / NBRC 33097 / NRRL 1555) TaxID=763407 RepID=A0A162T3C0_PHYB8|nr:hypothetical protein PHYBLDRAFT_73274 [Phycomyces blakesleeanus NRRL 1555(-)]OAD65952.1 hypothetical protein PHYBLDRAFT_73274 [Phycomyces blakesleeanus NRRL 1555(-)]|eukprot:XP_018283992.1 hypothetical protein PHYBLDRAFT_73274 [Phycomyces blakesleeanus NRRL 1555(-)]
MSDDRKLANILETYFSDANLLWDKVLQSKINNDPDGFVSFNSLQTLSRFKKLNATAQDIKHAAVNHSLSKLKEGLQKPYHTEQAIKELFGSLIGHVSFVRIPKNTQGCSGFYGFCFVEFDDRDNVNKAVRLLNRFNTSALCSEDQSNIVKTNEKKGENNVEDGDKNSNENVIEQANKLSLRVMSKSDWNKLKEEYLEVQAARAAYTRDQWSKYYASLPNTAEEIPGPEPQQQKKKKGEELPETMEYTKGIIVYVGNIHPKSSKTVISKLLEKSGLLVPYIGRKKGLDYCHARLSSPEDAQQLVKYFENHPVIQENHTDDTGKAASTADMFKVNLRIISGKEEEFYWQDDIAGSKKLFT